MTTELPPDVARVVGATITQYEEATRLMEATAAKYRRAATAMWIAFGGWVLSLASYLWLILGVIADPGGQ